MIAVEIAGSLTTAGRLSIGGRSGTNKLAVTVGGDFIMQSGSTTAIYGGRADTPAELTSLGSDASPVDVGGTLALEGTARLYSENDALSGGIVRYQAHAFTVAAAAEVNADQRGYAAFKYDIPGEAPDGIYSCADNHYTYGPGRGTGFQYGAGYGGTGGLAGATYGRTYGWRAAPYLAGSPNGAYGGNSAYSARGGGSLVFYADTISIAGKLTANGGNSTHGASSGGGIMLVANDFTFGSGANLSAVGGTVKYTSAGGGGRIAVIACDPTADEMALLEAGDEPASLSYEPLNQGMVASDVRGGLGAGVRVGNGTALYVMSEDYAERYLLVTGDAGEIGASTPPLGMHMYQEGSVIAFSMPDEPQLALDGRSAYTCIGYRYYDANMSSVVTNLALSGSLVLDKNYILEWLWDANSRQVVTLVEATSGGGIRVAEELYSGGYTNLRSPTASSPLIEAVAASGWEFLFWEGDMQAGKAFDNQLILSGDGVSRKIRPVFRLKEAATTRTFSGTGSWLDASRWSPANIPGSNDLAIIAGTCYVSNVVVAGAISIETAGTLVVGGLTASVAAQTAISDVYADSVAMRVYGSVTNAGKLSFGGRLESRPLAVQRRLDVDIRGDLLLANGSSSYFYAGQATMPESLTNIFFQASKFKVGGCFELAGTAKMFNESDYFTGGVIKYEAAEFILGASATINGTTRGYMLVPFETVDQAPAGIKYLQFSHDMSWCTYAPGSGYSYQYGGCYGGASYNLRPASGDVYGLINAPYLPGSPCGPYQLPNQTSRGGSAILISAGNMTLNGKITTNGGTQSHSASSGGGIMLLADKLEVGEGALLTAKGADDDYGGGGGGRIAVIVGATEAEVARLALGEEPETLTYGALARVPFDVSGGGGALLGGGSSERKRAGSGTAVYIATVAGDKSITVAGDVGEVGTTTPPYGVTVFPYQEEILFQGPEADALSADGEYRYTCIGYDLYDANANLLRHGTSNHFAQVADHDYRVVWNFTNQKVGLFSQADPAHGSIRSNGQIYSNTLFEVWREVGAATAAIEAVPNAGFEFLFWVGDVEYGQSEANPYLVQDHSVTRRLNPVFRVVAPPATRTLDVGSATVSRDWLQADYWSPDGILPGKEDDVIITGWVDCLATNTIHVKSLTLLNNARLRMAVEKPGTPSDTILNNVTHPNAKLGEIALLVDGDLTLQDAAQLTAGGQYQSNRWSRIAVAGDLSLFGTSRMQITAGETNNLFSHVSAAGHLTVGGTLLVTNSAILYLRSEFYTGGSVKIETDQLILGAAATISADSCGYGNYTDRNPSTLAPGRGWNYNYGGGHGGYGGNHNESYGNPYGYEFCPIEPGACAGFYWTDSTTWGGGLVRLYARRLNVYGTITASGSVTSGSGPAGGGIWLGTVKPPLFGPDAVLRADGGASGYTAPGGGGRIAVTHVHDFSQLEAMAMTGQLQPNTRLATEEEFFALYPGVTVSVVPSTAKGGRGTATDGTFAYITTKPHGTIMLLR